MRFPEFVDEWIEKSLGEIASFSKGKGISKAEITEDGQFECIRYGELYTYYNEVIDVVKSRTNLDRDSLVFSEANDVIIPASGETQLDIATASCVKRSDIALGGDLNIIKTPHNGVFLSYYLNSRKKLEIASLSQGISVVHLYSKQLSTLKISIPTKKEQDKISDFLALLDQRIKTQNKIIEELKLLKSTLCELLYSKVDENYEIESCIGDILDYLQPSKFLVTNTEYSQDNSLTPVLTANKSFILGYSEETEGICDIGECIIFDDFTMDIKFVDFPFKVKSSAIKILKPKPGSNIRYLFDYLIYLKLRSGEHKRHYISEIEPMKIKIPYGNEQKRVSNLMASQDKKIKLEENIVCQFKLQKGYLLKQLFR